jgi:hypothetical protein
VINPGGDQSREAISIGSTSRSFLFACGLVCAGICTRSSAGGDCGASRPGPTCRLGVDLGLPPVGWRALCLDAWRLGCATPSARSLGRAPLGASQRRLGDGGRTLALSQKTKQKSGAQSPAFILIHPCQPGPSSPKSLSPQVPKSLSPSFPQSSSSSPPRTLQLRNIELRHLHHGVHSRRVAHQLEDVRGNDLPAQSKLVF